MAKPRIFISSTYYDLKHIRASLEIFVESLGFEAILAEQGSIPYDSSQPLDETCYKEAENADILVLVVGGRYGSYSSSTESSNQSVDQSIESITRKEFTKAHEANVPVYVLIESGVLAEYQTYSRNKNNSNIEYAHVDTADVFKFIEFIYSKQKNNPVQSFDKGVEIETWLRDQWAGIFQELLRQKKEGSKISALSSQIRQLEAVNSTLKSYLETVLESVSPEKSTGIIEHENHALHTARLIENARENNWFEFIVATTNMDVPRVFNLHLQISGVNDIIPIYTQHIESQVLGRIFSILESNEDARQDFCKLRSVMDQSPVRFTKKFLTELENKVKILDPQH